MAVSPPFKTTFVTNQDHILSPSPHSTPLTFYFSISYSRPNSPLHALFRLDLLPPAKRHQKPPCVHAAYTPLSRTCSTEASLVDSALRRTVGGDIPTAASLVIFPILPECKAYSHTFNASFVTMFCKMFFPGISSILANRSRIRTLLDPTRSMSSIDQNSFPFATKSLLTPSHTGVLSARHVRCAYYCYPETIFHPHLPPTPQFDPIRR